MKLKGVADVSCKLFDKDPEHWAAVANGGKANLIQKEEWRRLLSGVDTMFVDHIYKIVENDNFFMIEESLEQVAERIPAPKARPVASDEEIQSIKTMSSEGMSGAAIARRLGRSQPFVWMILNGRRHKAEGR